MVGYCDGDDADSYFHFMKVNMQELLLIKYYCKPIYTEKLQGKFIIV